MPGVSISNKVLAIYQEIWGQELSFKSKGGQTLGSAS